MSSFDHDPMFFKPETLIPLPKIGLSWTAHWSWVALKPKSQDYGYNMVIISSGYNIYNI